MEDVREYLHLYIKQDVRVTTESAIFNGTLLSLYYDEWRYREGNILTAQVKIGNDIYPYKADKIKLILRRLDSMTEEEAKEFFKLHSTAEVLKLRPHKNGIVVDYRWIPDKLEYANDDGFSYSSVAASASGMYRPLEFAYLLSKGFWLFGDEAFDKGLIIDSKTLNKEV